MAKNTHLTHIDDFIFQPNGISVVKNWFIYIVAIMKKDVRKLSKIFTIKYDGSPAIICGYDRNEKFFVATKSFWNVTPKINYSEDDIIENHPDSEELQHKLIYALEYLPKIFKNPIGIFFGDILYTDDSLIQNSKFVGFVPNVTHYLIQKDTDVGEKIINSKIGVVWHNEFLGVDLANLQQSSVMDLSLLKKNKDVWWITSEVTVRKGIEYIDSDFELIDNYLEDIQLNYSDINQTNSTLQNKLITFTNELVRQDGLLWDSEDKIKLFEETNEVEDREKLKKLFELQTIVTKMKTKLITLMFNAIEMPVYSFIDQKRANEGYVFSVGGYDLAKLIDRTIFSKANFNNSVGWKNGK